jgi:hypothetical protein
MTSSSAGGPGVAPTGTATTYHERLWPSPWVWVSSTVFAMLCGLVVAKSSWIGAIVSMIAVSLLVAWMLAASTPTVSVTAGTFVAGKANIPVSLLGDVEVLDAERMRHLRGPGIDARAYLCIRGWLPLGIRVTLTDPDDPTPYWLVSSRRPQALADALAAAVPQN